MISRNRARAVDKPFSGKLAVLSLFSVADVNTFIQDFSVGDKIYYIP
jgi:hypothetical protein